MQRNQYETVILGTAKKDAVHNKSHAYKDFSRRPESTVKNQKLDQATEPDKIKTFDREYCQTVIQARVDKKWNRDKLASMLCVKKSKVDDLENGKLIYSGAFKSQVNRVLNISK